MSTTIEKYFGNLNQHAQRSKRRSICEWKANRTELERRAGDPKLADMKYIRPVGIATVLSMEMEREIIMWINMLRKDGVPVSSAMLQYKALDAAEEAGVTPFSASWHWQKRFLRRYRLSLRARTRQGQLSFDQADAIAVAFGEKVKQKMAELGIKKVFNADQTAVFFENLPKYSISPRGAKTVWVRHPGKDKERVTVVLLGDSEVGKANPFVVFKTTRSKVPGGDLANWTERRGFEVHVWKDASAIMTRTGMELYGNPTAWWNASTHMEFLKNAFGSRTRPWQPIVLLVDDFSGHWADGIDAYARSIDVHLLKVSPSCTSTCQPADIAWNRPFKCYLRHAWVVALRQQFRDHSGDGAFKLQPPSRSMLCDWISTCWAKLSRTTIQNGFRKAHMIPPLGLPTDEIISSMGAQPLSDDVFATLEATDLVDGRLKDLTSDDELDDDGEAEQQEGDAE